MHERVGDDLPDLVFDWHDELRTFVGAVAIEFMLEEARNFRILDVLDDVLAVMRNGQQSGD